MCGRFVAASPPEEVARYFDVDQIEPALLADSVANYNVAPTDDVLVVHDDDAGRRLDRYRWGLVPFWAQDVSIGPRMINARSETAATKNAFADALVRRRCIVPADGFYEWDRRGPERRAFFVHPPDGEMFAFAGLWARWRGEIDGVPVTVRSVTVLTGPPNASMAEIHDRMPIFVPATRWAEWLDPSPQPAERWLDMFTPAPGALTAKHAVSLDVGNVRNNHPGLITPVETVEPLRLFDAD